MSYSTAFKQIDSRTINATQSLVKNGLWKKDLTVQQKYNICDIWVTVVSEIYGIEKPTFRFDPDERMYNLTGGGHYEPHANRITLFKKFSLVTLMHEFRHHMQYQMYDLKLYKGHVEEDARAWSVSLFKLALPKSYQNAVNKRILHFN